MEKKGKGHEYDKTKISWKLRWEVVKVEKMKKVNQSSSSPSNKSSLFFRPFYLFIHHHPLILPTQYVTKLRKMSQNLHLKCIKENTVF
ncbi:hypothetical protein TSUD_305310 [Trifolium subterraneum]|uniref:Uncharacterized protein n=1 Tax=Trifolium subterraneum TaxID=3900 RepID=A0A2Z6NEK1_TRISU|nr:hypothetical protein TSUD_305310 [Trifolium subterraneum]